MVLSAPGVLELAVLGINNYLQFDGEFRSVAYLWQYFSALGYYKYVRAFLQLRRLEDPDAPGRELLAKGWGAPYHGNVLVSEGERRQEEVERDS